MQPDRILSKTNTSKKLFTINEEDEFLKDGVEIDRLAGVNAKMTYENKINEYLK